jgi:hypothetical protein
MMKVTQKAKKHINSKELQRKFSRRTYAPKKTFHNQMKMKSVEMRQKEFYSWKYKTLIKKTPKKNMTRKKTLRSTRRTRKKEDTQE